ncbi:MAG: HAD family hydrolase [Nitrososphaerota archaeon]
MGIDAVIFDLDGTIIDFSLRILDARKEFIKRIRSMGVDLGALDAHRPAEIIITYLEKFRGIPRECSRRILDECMEPYELEAAELARLRSGASRVLESLRRAGYKIGLASNNSGRCVEIVLDRLGLRGFFDAIVSRDDTMRLKPHEEIVVKAIERLNAPPRRSVYVGDSASDMIAGRRAGAHVVAVAGGADSRDRLLRSGAEYIVDELDELIEVIEVIEERGL